MKLCSFCNFENPDGVDFCDVCHAPLTSAEESLDTDRPDLCSRLSGDCIGQVIGMRYIITGEPAWDGIGRVCQGEDAADESDIMIHEIDARACDDQKTLCEIRSAFNLPVDAAHDNILFPIDVQLEEPFKFFITKQKCGSALSEKLRQGPLSVGETLGVFTQIAAGLDYAHTRCILHGDIIPDNILIDQNGKACLANFGISRIIKDAVARSSGIRSGRSRKFLSGEAVEGNPVRRSDIYSLAACIYFALGGKIDDSRLLPLGVLSDEQNQALQKALSGNPVLRQPSALQLLKELGVDESGLGWNTVSLCAVNISQGAGGRIVLPDVCGAAYDKNTDIRIEACCDENYHFAGWSGTAVDKGKVADPKALKTTLTIDDDYTLSADFAIDRHILKLSATAGGAVTKPENQNERFDHGSVVLIEACADEMYRFVNWTGDGVTAGRLDDAESPLTSITVDACYSIKASFEVKSYQLKLEATEGGIVSAGAKFTRYDHGSSVEVKAVPETNYHFVKWQGAAVEKGLVADAGAADTMLTVEGDYGLEAVFAIDRHLIDLSASEGGRVVEPVGDSMEFEHGQTVRVIAEQADNYHFVEWVGSAAAAGMVDDVNSMQTTVKIKGDYTLQAVFATNKKKLTVSSSVGGTVTSPGEGEFDFDYGQQVTVRARADEGYKFKGWPASVVERGKTADDESESITVVMDSDYSLYAEFQEQKPALASAKGSQAVENRKPAMLHFKMIAGAALIFVLLIFVFMIKISGFKDSLDGQLGQAKVFAAENRYAEAVAIGSSLTDNSPDFAEENDVEKLLGNWRAQLLAQEKWQAARSLAGQLKYKQAVLEARSLLSEYPGSYYCSEVRGALADWEGVITKKTEFSRLLAEAKAAMEKDDIEISLNSVKAALKIFPDNEEAEFLKEKLVKKRDDRKAADNRKFQFDVIMERALKFEKNKDWLKAEKYYWDALTFDPDDAELKEKVMLCRHNNFNSIAEKFEKNGDYEAAVENYRIAMSYKSVQSTDKKLDLARKALARVLAEKQTKSNIEKLMQLADKAFKEKNFDVAVKLYDDARQIDDESREIRQKLVESSHALYVRKGETAGQNGDHEKAREMFSKALRYKQDDETEKLLEFAKKAHDESEKVLETKSKITAWLKAASEARNKGNVKEAFGYDLKAARAGDSGSMVTVGIALYKGMGIKADPAKAVEFLRKAFQQGHSQAAFYLGLSASEGKGSKKDFRAAAEYFEKAAQAGLPEAMYYFSKAYYNGQGVSKDLDKAMGWLSKSANAGNVWAMHNLAMFYFDGVNGKKDIDAAVKWYEKAALAGDVDAMFNLGVIYFKGQGVEKNQARALWWITRAAESGSSEAMLRLAIAYHNGVTVAADHTAAYDWFSKAAGNGSLEAMDYLGSMYAYGNGVEKDPVKGLEWFAKAAGRGYIKSMTNLAVMYFEGSGVERDYPKAIELFTKAAAGKSGEAMYYMGRAYAGGNGVDKNMTTAVEWFTKAAGLGESKSMYELGQVYNNAQGVELDFNEAFKWYEVAAYAGRPMAMYQLGQMYEKGKGTELDPYESVPWYQKAARLGHAPAKKRLVELEETW